VPTTSAPNPDGGRETEFVSEPLTPEPGSGSVEAMSRGEPGLPKAFRWRGQRYEIASVQSSWKSRGEDRGDVYVRRHWYDVVTVCGRHMRLYFDRNPGRGGTKSKGWWVFSVDRQSR
jgi:uncharacterized protein DUF6504